MSKTLLKSLFYMLKLNGQQFIENSIIELCILPSYTLEKLFDSIETDLMPIFIDSRGCLSALNKFNQNMKISSSSQIENKKGIKLMTINSTIYKIDDISSFENCCENLKKQNKILCFFDSLPALIDTLTDFNHTYTIYNRLWKLIYFNNFTFIVINHYRICDKFYVPRLGVLWISNVSYRILVKYSKYKNEFEIVQTPDKRIEM